MKYMNILAATALSATVAATAFAAEAIVSKIEVDSDFASVDSTMAASYWPKIEADLEARLAETLAGRAGNDGVEISVSIRSLAVNAAASTESYTDLNDIEGVVAIRGPNTDSPTVSFPVAYSVVAPTGTTLVTEGLIVLKPDTSDNYNALIGAIVDEVEKRVSEINM